MIGGGVRPKGVDPINTTYPTFSRSIKFMDFYPFADIETITSRLRLFITGEDAHSYEFREDAYWFAAEPKELYVVPDVGHVDFYDCVILILLDKLETFKWAPLPRETKYKFRYMQSIPGAVTHPTVSFLSLLFPDSAEK